jgi:hypothetical protein
MEGRLRRGPPRPRAAHPAPRGLRPPNLLIVLAAATLGNTRLIDNVDVFKRDGED